MSHPTRPRAFLAAAAAALAVLATAPEAPAQGYGGGGRVTVLEVPATALGGAVRLTPPPATAPPVRPLPVETAAEPAPASKPAREAAPESAPAPVPPAEIPPPQRTPDNPRDNVADEVVVLNLGPQDLATLQAEGFEVLEVLAVPGLSSEMLRLRIPPGVALFDAWRRVRALPTGEVSDFNHFYRGVQEGSSCLAATCPERALVGWPVALNRATACGHNITIGMVDSGINEAHETFRGAALTVTRMSPDSLPPSRNAHGTAVAALLVGDPASRSPGLVPGARLVAVDAFHLQEDDERSDLFTIIDGLGFLADNGVAVINLSLAGPHNLVLEHVMLQLTGDLDIVVVAAVGNAGPEADPAYPAGYPDVVAVTAVDKTGALYDRAIRGPHVDISAPGVEVWTAASVKGARWKTGTSFAAPFVTAAAAILRDSRPELHAADVTAELHRRARDLGDPGFDAAFGAGLVLLDAFCS